MGSRDLIVLDGVGKRFEHDRDARESIRQWFIRTTSGRRRARRAGEFSIEDVSIRVSAAETVALLGDNGSGKSTLLRLMAGIYAPSRGQISSRGRIGAVLELGAGFHKELTGEDNLAMYAAALGLSRSEYAALAPDMVAFADIGDVLHKPIKHYSTGMQARLAMAVVLCGIFDLILLDEALSVGDRLFRAKVEQRITSYIESGGSLVLASHNLDFLKRTCDRAIWLDRGRVRADGPAAAVVDKYRRARDGA